MTTIDNKYNTLVFDGTTATLTITHKKPRNHKTKVEFGSHTISYGAITSARLATAGFTVHGYQIVLDPPLPEVGTQFDLYGVWIRRAEQKAFEAAIHQADKYELSEPWDAPQVDNVGTRLAANVKKTKIPANTHSETSPSPETAPSPTKPTNSPPPEHTPP